MSSPIEGDDPERPTDEQPVTRPPARTDPPDDPEVPEADGLEQRTEVEPGLRVGPVARGFEVPEADAIDQATDEPFDDE